MAQTERHQIFPKHVFADIRREKPQIQVSTIVIESASLGAAGVHAKLQTRPQGLTAAEAGKNARTSGPMVNRDATVLGGLGRGI